MVFFFFFAICSSGLGVTQELLPGGLNALNVRWSVEVGDCEVKYVDKDEDVDKDRTCMLIPWGFFFFYLFIFRSLPSPPLSCSFADKQARGVVRLSSYNKDSITKQFKEVMFLFSLSLSLLSLYVCLSGSR